MSISTIGSVVIPAHNEATTIRRCHDALLAGFAPGELDVAVSCNGCTDGTADIVRSSWPAVQVIEVTKASKPAALRAADEALSVSQESTWTRTWSFQRCRRGKSSIRALRLAGVWQIRSAPRTPGGESVQARGSRA